MAGGSTKNRAHRSSSNSGDASIGTMLSHHTVLSCPTSHILVTDEALCGLGENIDKKHLEQCETPLQETIKVTIHHEDSGLLRNFRVWDDSRKLGHVMLHSPLVEQMVVLLVVVQLGFAIYITDLTAVQEGHPEVKIPLWFNICNAGFLSIYVFELALRFYVYRDNFFECRWHCLDLFVVSCDILSEVVGAITQSDSADVSLGRLLRILRVARAGRLLRYFPEIFIMVKSLAGAFRVVFWSFIIIALLLLMWSLVAVSYIHPLNLDIAAPACKQAYSTVYDTFLTFIQTVVAGDSFGLCSMPLMRQHPWTLIYFMGVLGSVGLGLMNLVLSAIVDRAAEVREQNNQLLNLTRHSFYEDAKSTILKCCARHDTKGDGTITYDFIMEAYDQIDDFQDACDTLNVSKSDLSSVFFMMDDRECGEVDATTFAEHLLRLKVDSQHSTVVMIKQQLVTMSKQLTREMDAVKADIKLLLTTSLSTRGQTVSSLLTQDWIPALDASTLASDKRWLDLIEARNNLISEQSAERLDNMLEALQSAAKLLEDFPGDLGIDLSGLSALLLDLRKQNATVRSSARAENASCIIGARQHGVDRTNPRGDRDDVLGSDGSEKFAVAI